MDLLDAHADPAIVAVAEDAASRIQGHIDEGVEGEPLLDRSIAGLRETRFLQIAVPSIHGGLGGDILDACAALMRVARVFGSAALVANMHTNFVGQAQVSGLWPQALLDAFLRGVVGEGYLANNTHAEHDMGSPARGGLPATTATRVDGGWRIDGAKQWATGAPYLTHFGVSATVHAAGMPDHLGHFLVRRDAEGVRIDPTWHALAMRESASHDIQFEGVFVPDAEVIRVSPDGAPHAVLLDVAPWHGLTFAATYTGIAIGARDWIMRFAVTRVPTNLGTPIGELPAVQAKLGEIEALLLASQRLIFGLARDWAESGDRAMLAAQVPLAKYVATNNAIRVTDLAMRVAGGFGVLEAEPLERRFRDVRSGLIHPPLDDVALASAAKRAMQPYAKPD